MAYLNFDMIGSPNYVRFVYDGDASAPELQGQGIAGPPGSQAVEKTFNRYFIHEGMAFKPTPLSGRSDYAPFAAIGVPVGGLFTGAEGIKTPQEARIFGGTAGIPYDPCYHQACDRLRNVNLQALSEMSDAAAHATLTYAIETIRVAKRNVPVHPHMHRGPFVIY